MAISALITRPLAAASFGVLTLIVAAPSQPAADVRVVFTDITASTGITFTHVFDPDKKYIVESMSGGVALFDFDKDGWLDVYLTNAPTVATARSCRVRHAGIIVSAAPMSDSESVSG